MVDEARVYLMRQFETAWKLTNFDLDGLATDECLWRPAHKGLHCIRSLMERGAPIGRITRDMTSVRRASRG
jgi:hypothetical protein